MDDVCERLLEICMGADTDDPVRLFRMMVRDDGVPMHSRYHHIIVPLALTAAYWKATGDFDLRSYLNEVVSRASEVPEMICGYWGSCGSAIGTGLFFSVITRTSPVSKGRRWGQCNLMTSRSLSSIAEVGGPRCCKRNAVLSITSACAFLKENAGIELHPSTYGCTREGDNPECIGRRCPYYIIRNESNVIS